MDLRFKRSVANAIKNIVEKEKNRRRFIPALSIGQSFCPGTVTANDLPIQPTAAQDEKIIAEFRQLVRDRLGSFALAVFDVRLAGGQTKSLIGSAAIGGRGRILSNESSGRSKHSPRSSPHRLAIPSFFEMSKERWTAKKRRRRRGRRRWRRGRGHERPASRRSRTLVLHECHPLGDSESVTILQRDTCVTCFG